MALEEDKTKKLDVDALQRVIDEQDERIGALEHVCAFLCMGMLMSLNATAYVARETGIIEDIDEKEKIDEAMTEYLKNHTAGNA